MISFEDFEKVDIRVGIIREVQEFPEARKPSYKIKVDFGIEIGVKWSSTQATNYSTDELIGMQVIAVVNFPPKKIAGFPSQVLILGVPQEDGQVSILTPTRKAKVGSRVY